MKLASRLQRLFAPAADEAFAGLAARYGETCRAYHTLAHIEDCLTVLDQADHPGDRRPVELAIWWHDAIYDARRSDNEAMSAELADGDLAKLGVDADERAEVRRLILLTAGHQVPAGDDDGALLVSIDLSILGRSAELYDRYADAIRHEYAFVPEAAYRAGRAGVLARFLAGPIFPDPAFRDRFEAQARRNLEREITSLTRAI